MKADADNRYLWRKSPSRLEAEVVISTNHQVMTRVQVIPGAVQAARTSEVVAPRAVWSPIEVFRLANREIVGRWSQTDGLSLARPLAAQRLNLPVPTPRVVSLVRQRGPVWRFTGEARVNGKLCAEAEFSAMIMDNQGKPDGAAQ